MKTVPMAPLTQGRAKVIEQRHRSSFSVWLIPFHFHYNQVAPSTSTYPLCRKLNSRIAPFVPVG